MISAGKLAAILVAAIAGVNVTNVDAGPISYTGDVYTENFESLGWLTYPNRALWVDDSTLPGWYASGVKYLYGSIGYAVIYSGSSIFSYRSAGDSALGSQNSESGPSSSVRFGVQIVNDTSAALAGFTLSYVGEQWRVSGDPRVEQLSFDYALNALSLTAGEYVPLPTLDFLSPIYGNDIPFAGLTLDGNLPANRTPISTSITGLNWMPGDSLWLRWTDTGEGAWGYGSALAIDDLVFTAESAASPVDTPWTSMMTPQGPMSISEPSTGWLAGLCIAALAVVTRCPRKHSARTEAAVPTLTQ